MSRVSGGHDDSPAAHAGVRGAHVESGQDPPEPRGAETRHPDTHHVSIIMFRSAESMLEASGISPYSTQATG